MKNHRFPVQILYIDCTSVATQHARCHKEYYPPRGQAVSTSHFSVHGQRPFCVSKAILHFWKSSTPQKSQFFVKFRHLARATGAPMQTLSSLDFFYIRWIELRFCMRKAITSMTVRKILLAKTNWFFHAKSSLFDRKSNIVCTSLATQHPRCH